VRRQTKRETFYATLTGRRLTSFSTAGGRACLAHLPRAEVEAMLARADRVLELHDGRLRPV